MGAECPNGHGRQNIIVNITADGSPPQHPEDVIAQKLACGCVVGGEEYTRFQEAVQKVSAEEANALAAVRKNAQAKKAAAYRQFVLNGGQNNAE